MLGPGPVSSSCGATIRVDPSSSAGGDRISMGRDRISIGGDWTSADGDWISVAGGREPHSPLFSRPRPRAPAGGIDGRSTDSRRRTKCPRSTACKRSAAFNRSAADRLAPNGSASNRSAADRSAPSRPFASRPGTACPNATVTACNRSAFALSAVATLSAAAPLSVWKRSVGVVKSRVGFKPPTTVPELLAHWIKSGAPVCVRSLPRLVDSCTTSPLNKSPPGVVATW